MKTIAFDVMGNDNGVQAGVSAARKFSQANPHYGLILIGDKQEMMKYGLETKNISFLDVAQTANLQIGIRESRRVKSSMNVAIDLVKNQKADAVISSGDSGIFLALATLNLKRLKGITRPAFMPIFPTIIKNQKFLMLDVGANLKTTPEMMQQWAVLGSAFSKSILKIDKPKVAIVNIGTEKYKGTSFHTSTYDLIENLPEINFKGFVEARELLKGAVDVAIVDGYAGNMILKTMEGAIGSFSLKIKKTLRSKLRYKIGYLFIKSAFSTIKEELDYRNVGAAWVIGLNGIVIKCHGSADEKSYLSALNQVQLALENNTLQSIKEFL